MSDKNTVIFDDKELDVVIRNCMWRQDMDGISICKGELAPCLKVIESFKCDTLKEYFGKGTR